MLFTTRSTNPFPLLLLLLTLLALDILHVVVLVSFHPRCCFYYWCPRFDSATAVLCRLSLLHLLLPSNCLIVWRTQFCFISVFFFFVFFAFHSLFALCSLSLFLLLRLTVVRWSDSPRAATIATHLNFIGSPVTLPFRTDTHTPQTTTMRMPKKANKSSWRRSKNKAVERCQRNGRMISFLMPYREIWDDSHISSRWF